MKALVLAGGKGTRMRPISDSMPKHLVPVANKPVIDYVIDDIEGCGIREIGVVVEKEDSEIAEHLSQRDREAEISYIVNEDPKGGLAYAVNCGREFVDEDPFLLYFGDTLFSREVTRRLVNNFDEEHVASIGLQRTSEPSRYGIAEFDEEGSIVGMHEKPDTPPSDLAYVGAVILSPEVFEVIDQQEPSERGELEITDSIDQLIRRGDYVNVEEVDGLWRDIGKPKDVVRANQELLEEGLLGAEHSVGEGSSIAESAEVREPCKIGENVVIGPEATVGPYTSIGDNCHVSNATVTSSILMDDVELTADVELEDSLVGPGTEIKSSGSRFFLGRESYLEL